MSRIKCKCGHEFVYTPADVVRPVLDMVFTDPPYNINYRGGVADDGSDCK